MRYLLILSVFLTGCRSNKGLATNATIVNVGKNTIVVNFPCVDQKPFTKPCYALAEFNRNEFDTVYVGKKLILK